MPSSLKLAIIGGGPAGLRAAEISAQNGAEVTLFDAKPSVGRKLLVAGRGGLNLTHGEEFEGFVQRYSGPRQPKRFWHEVLSAFSPAHLREWAASLGIETFQQRTGRVYPREMKAAPLLRRWIERLRGLGVAFQMNHRWTGLVPGTPHILQFDTPDGSKQYEFDVVILALGGASWPITGSDGGWVDPLGKLGIHINPLQPANCGWEIEWSPALLAVAEGQPLKNIVLHANNREATGELMITSYGLEGGAIYQLCEILRKMNPPVVEIDLKPTFTVYQLATKLESVRRDWLVEAQRRWKLSDAATALLAFAHGDKPMDATSLATTAKHCRLQLSGPRPIEEAISSAGGVCWDELDENLMLKKIPGVYIAGEMIDWEAPTGGYLMQGCFATSMRAALAATRNLRPSSEET